MSVIVLVTASGCRFLLGEGPDNNESIDAAKGSASIDAAVPADVNTDPKCGWGGAGLPQGGICLSELPTSSPAIATTINTDTSNLCVAYSKGGGTYCVVSGVDLVMANVRVTGSKPLVLIATDRITISGVLDVASHTATASRGPGTDPTACDYGLPPGNGSNPETRGGAGGSFGGSGGRGGLRNGQPPATDSGVPGAPATIAPPAVLRGGCHGQNGYGPGAALGGFGGGAVYLVAGMTIDVASAAAINASGAGGNGGPGNTPKGGAGAGSGGMIVIEAPTVNIAGRVFADGGGGGEGGGTNNPGNYGYESDGTARAPGGNGGAGNGGDGGAGSYGTNLSGIDGNNNGADSGGGGGGGAGVIWLHAPAGTQSGIVSPAPKLI
jgi:hypothetical protein